MSWTAPRTWVAGEIITAALLNQHLRDQLLAISDPWTSYTPTWTAGTTNPVLGNGTLVGSFSQVGKWVRYRLLLTIGSTTTLGAGAYSFSLPVTAVGTQVAGATVVTSGGSKNSGAAEIVVTSAVRALYGGGSVTPSAPFALGTGDTISISGTYEAA